MGKSSEERETRVGERKVSGVRIQSSAGHEESRVKQGGPPSKAKYKETTDRGSTVRERRKEPRERSEIESETISLQAVGASKDVTACLLKNEPAS